MPHASSHDDARRSSALAALLDDVEALTHDASLDDAEVTLRLWRNLRPSRSLSKSYWIPSRLALRTACGWAAS